jgi:hypothetical protein
VADPAEVLALRVVVGVLIGLFAKRSEANGEPAQSFINDLTAIFQARKRTQKSAFLLWGWLVESRIHLIFLDALRRITALSEVLLFRAVA